MNGFVRVEIREEIRQTNLENTGEVRQVLILDAMTLAFNLCDHLPRYIQTFQLQLNCELRLRPAPVVTELPDLRPH